MKVPVNEPERIRPGRAAGPSSIDMGGPWRSMLEGSACELDECEHKRGAPFAPSHCGIAHTIAVRKGVLNIRGPRSTGETTVPISGTATGLVDGPARALCVMCKTPLRGAKSMTESARWAGAWWPSVLICLHSTGSTCGDVARCVAHKFRQ